MNIFLDTTVTFSDPFFKRNYNRNLLKLARDYKDLTFYMSEIVYKETKRHFEKNVKENLENLNKAQSKLQNYKRGYFDTGVDARAEIEQNVKGLLKDFETFYTELQEDGLLHILSCPDNILPDLIDRAVNRLKPFKENKSEFRDAATWLTYAKYTEQNDLSDCYFISENVSDFFDDKKENIHTDLLKDSTKFKPFFTLMKLAQEDGKIQLYIKEKQEKEQRIQEWIDENNIDENFVLGYFKESSFNGLFNQIYSLSSDYISSLNRINLDGTNYNGEPNLDGIDITEIQDFNIEIIAEEIIVSGELIIEADCTIQEVYKFDDETIYEGIPFSLGIIQPFSFTLEKNKSMINLQFEEIGIFSKAIVDPTIHF
ncbi:PIN domain-containing protein [Sutcliffiella horikoshii]|uniref:PIN domain-containing protein n=1 Tax=Sutcliffiella horikoshii TaxID=79883 RepID=UPI00203DDA09|nr:PIN domain-containing protein [Sutcliffiella horikoshii]MCM3617681.1 PIN domain-containing protein [Sutcliffiella horikoshii]